MKPSNPNTNPCPCCGGPSVQRSCRTVTPIFRTLYFACKNEFCGCTFAAALEVTHIVSLSAIENPRYALPYRPVQRRRPGTEPVPANDPQPLEAAAAH
ncbi:ogr/Delta-like zinc finger family protein [Brevundimonas sp. UBA7664]|uniref:ogr/Delta-like zinc finger family protein n=1 Tax=Brevundimonas sp. UBA7664 TaxID=1946141 RepID=UPI0025C1EB38|nr:ogr/Delta-like zinc finger family protein [Brevundimonas sp. UBA7664]